MNGRNIAKERSNRTKGKKRREMQSFRVHYPQNRRVI